MRPGFSYRFAEQVVNSKLAIKQEIENLLTIGRHGLFLNNSMDDNVLLGTKVADAIVSKGFQSQAWLQDMLGFMNLRFQGK